MERHAHNASMPMSTADPEKETLRIAAQSPLQMTETEAGIAAARPRLSAYSVPRLPEGQEWVIRAFAVIAWVYGVYWLWWRWTVSLNWQSPIFSLSLVLAETYGLIASGLLILTVWRLRHREAPPVAEGLDVDVFITCFDEPLQLLRRTAIGARAIRYPHKTHILDDGKRDEVKAMAENLGIGYIRREGNDHAKAGNLNHALGVTSGKFILQLDADHVPLPNILDKLLGFFDDEKVAFVQSPQDFYNTDSFTHVVNDEGRRLWEENRIFFSLIQPGKDNWNAAFFCGSCGVLRRSAFESIGGFSTKTVTEDMETSIVLHAQGWKSVYYGETLAYGLAPASAGQYHVQRLRWGQGSMQILRKINPLRYPGLTLMQRIQYFASTFGYLDGLQKLIFYLSPIVYFLFGALPVRVTDQQLLIRLVPFMLLTITSFELLSRGTGWILISERYNMTKFFTYILAITGYFTKRPLKFQVTPKGQGDVPFNTYAPQLTLAVLSGFSLVWATLAYRNGWIDYHVVGWSSAAFWFNGGWALWNLYFAAFVVRQSLESKQLRHDHRFIETLPVTLRVLGGGSDGATHVAMTQELNASGLSVRGMFTLEKDARVEVPLRLTTGDFVVRGEVKRVTERKTQYGRVFEYGIQFEGMSLEDRDAIELHCTQHSVPFWRTRYRQSVPVFAHAFERLSEMRFGKRRIVQLPAIVRLCPPNEAHCDLGIGLLEEVSDSGARLMLENPVEPGSKIMYDVPGTDLTGTGTVVFNRAFESPANVRFAVGVQRDRSTSPKLFWPTSWRWPFAARVTSA